MTRGPGGGGHGGCWVIMGEVETSWKQRTVMAVGQGACTHCHQLVHLTVIKMVHFTNKELC